MFSPSFRLLLVIAACSAAGLVPAAAATTRKNTKAAAAEVNHNAYRSAIVLDAATGRVLRRGRGRRGGRCGHIARLLGINSRGVGRNLTNPCVMIWQAM